jgi:hypothetical protein
VEGYSNVVFINLRVPNNENKWQPMRWNVKKIGLRSLVACAAVALVLLTVFSDLMPAKVEGFEDAVSGDKVSVDCVVVHCNRSRTGLIMTAMDRDGVQASIFFQPSILAEPVPAGSLVRVSVTPSDDDPMFMFASSAEVLSYPE